MKKLAAVVAQLRATPRNSGQNSVVTPSAFLALVMQAVLTQPCSAQGPLHDCLGWSDFTFVGLTAHGITLSTIQCRIYYPGETTQTPNAGQGYGTGYPFEVFRPAYDSTPNSDPIVGEGTPVLYLHGLAAQLPPVQTPVGPIEEMVARGHIVIALNEDPPAYHPLYEAGVVLLASLPEMRAQGLGAILPEPWALPLVTDRGTTVIGHSKGGGHALRLSSAASPVSDKIVSTLAYAPMWAHDSRLYCSASNPNCTVSSPPPMSVQIVPPCHIMSWIGDPALAWAAHPQANYLAIQYFDKIKAHTTIQGNYDHSGFLALRNSTSGIAGLSLAIVAACLDSTVAWVEYWERGVIHANAPIGQAQVGQHGSLEKAFGPGLVNGMMDPILSIQTDAAQPQAWVFRTQTSSGWEYHHRALAQPGSILSLLSTGLAAAPYALPPVLGLMRLDATAVAYAPDVVPNSGLWAFDVATAVSQNADLWYQATAMGRVTMGTSPGVYLMFGNANRIPQ